jgi:hypothetical protein
MQCQTPTSAFSTALLVSDWCKSCIKQCPIGFYDDDGLSNHIFGGFLGFEYCKPQNEY